MNPAVRTLLYFGIIGLVVAGSVITVAEVTPFFPRNGSLVVEIIGAPPEDPRILSLNVTIDSFEVHRRGILNLTGEWIEMVEDAPRTLELARLDLAGMTSLLARASVPEGQITTIRLHVASASAKLQGVEETVSLKVPSGMIQIPVRSIEVRSGKTTTVTVDFAPEVEWSSCIPSLPAPATPDCSLRPVITVKNVHGPA